MSTRTLHAKMNVKKSKKKISNTNCCVYGCHSRKFTNPSLSFHTFPKYKTGFVQMENKLGIVESVDRRKAWENKLLMGKPTTSTMLVCSLHFTKDNFYFPDVQTYKPRLKKSAVPSCNLPKRKCYVEKSKTRIKRSNRLSRCVNNVNMPLDIPTCSSSVEGITSTTCKNNGPKQDFARNIRTETDKEAAEVLLSISNMPPLVSLQKTVGDKTLVKSGELVLPFIENINSDAKLNSLTGIPSLKVLNVIVTLCKKFGKEKRQR